MKRPAELRKPRSRDVKSDSGGMGAQADTPGSIFIRFLKFGCLAWGGPAAQIAMIKRECVDEEQWISEETFKTTLAVYQVMPGPEAHELCVYFGRIRGGKLGGFLAGLGFMLPGFLLMLGLSVLYVEADLGDQLAVVFYGLSAAVVALLARAVMRLGTSFVTDVPLALIAAGAFVLTLLTPASSVLVLLGAGLVYEIWKTAGARSRCAGSRRSGCSCRLRLPLERSRSPTARSSSAA